jgi:DNA polymerase-3 subunit gamma/tau
MSYLVYARKWRPQNFDQIVGQEHITTTLKNAITLNRVAHAYLFSGPRGVGKTSTARILARALNCEKGPVIEPCNSCDSCREISEGRSLDTIEIDGASNRGIDQIRQLRENVKFVPARGRFKVYIIDEVHQITTDGFNALLKTLEEPPAHVKFIFATTRAHKVLPTIISRCQRFDFKPLSVSFISGKLKRIIEAEKLNVTDEALLYIARTAAGSMRDAESILDQLSSFGSDEVNLEKVSSVLGLINLDTLWKISRLIIERKTAEALILLQELINEGKDLSQFTAGLMEQFRNILITRTISGDAKNSFIDLPGDYVERISEQGKNLTLEEILYIFNVLVRAQEQLKRALSGRVILEMAIVKLTRRGNVSSPEEILKKLGQIEQNLGKAASAGCVVKSSPVEDKPEPQIESDSLPPAQADEPGREESNHNWPRLLAEIKKEKIFLASFLEYAEMLGVKNGILTIAFTERHNFYKENLDQPENKKVVETKAKEIFGPNVQVKFIIDKNLEPSLNRQEYLPEETEDDHEPIIQSALKMFEGQIIKKQ